MAPKLFCQLYTIHGSFMGKIFPLVYSLLPDKSKHTYLRLFQHVSNIAWYNGYIFNPECAMMDFEAGAMNALQEVIPWIVIKGCYFHFSQSIWRKVQALGLVSDYINCEDTRRWIRRLSVLPVHQIGDAFLAITRDAPTSHQINNFTAYMKTIDAGSQFSP
nr:uncharacterized protein LOC122273274 [Parasteatoda tepidariorum]